MPFRLQPATKVTAHHAQILSVRPDMTLISSAISNKGRRKFELYIAPVDQRDPRQPRPETIWKANYDEPSGNTSEQRMTCMLPLDLEHIILGFSVFTLATKSTLPADAS